MQVWQNLNKPANDSQNNINQPKKETILYKPPVRRNVTEMNIGKPSEQKASDIKMPEVKQLHHRYTM